MAFHGPTEGGQTARLTVPRAASPGVEAVHKGVCKADVRRWTVIPAFASAAGADRRRVLGSNQISCGRSGPRLPTTRPNAPSYNARCRWAQMSRSVRLTRPMICQERPGVRYSILKPGSDEKGSARSGWANHLRNIGTPSRTAR